MKKWVGLFLVICILVFGAVFFIVRKPQPVKSPLGQVQNIIKPLNKYTFDNLRKYPFPANTITLGKEVQNDSPTMVASRMFYYSADVALDGKLKKVSGLMNLPKAPGNYPVIVMFRGFVPLSQYFSGDGTQHAGEFFAQNGFITLAPDFLGYGESDPGAGGFENRFQTYATALSLLASLKNLNESLSASAGGSVTADLDHIGLWGHSNGGHITLSVLGITGKPYPTVLWAPVSKSFPYSILEYTDEDADQGKELRKELAQFELLYNTDDFDPTRSYKNVTAPMEIHQGMSDVEVPWFWSENLADQFKKQNLDVTLFEYPGADHNLSPASLGWNSAVARSLEFYQEKL